MQEFTVKFRNEQVVGYGAAFYTHMDGREMQGLSVYPYESTTMKGVYETLSSIRPFEFARLKLKGEYTCTWLAAASSCPTCRG